MRPRLIWLALMALTLFVMIGGCGDRRQAFDTAMRASIADLRAGDFAGASSSLDIARSNADDSSQRSKVKDLGMLISGADAYCRGNRSQASVEWSATESPEFRHAIGANGQSLGVALAPASRD